MGLLTKNQNRIFLGISKGKITHRVQGQDEPELFDGIEGVLKDIVIRKASVKEKEMEFMDLIIQDGGNEYDLSVLLESGVARSLIMSLASIQNFVGRLSIEPYMAKDGIHTNVAVTFNAQKVGWVVSMSELPALEKIVTANGKEFIDDSKRSAYLRNLLTGIQQRVAAAQATPRAAAAPAPDVEDVEDLPGEAMMGDGSFFAEEGPEEQ